MKHTAQLPFAVPNAPLVLGIDPGSRGAFCFLYPDGKIEVGDLVLDADGVTDVMALAEVIRAKAPSYAVVEECWARSRPGKDGKRISSGGSNFNFGQNYMAAKAAVRLTGFTLHTVTPQKWKAFLGLSSKKEESRLLAAKLWPRSTYFSRKMDEGRAEAALIAKWGQENLWNAHRFAKAG